MKKKISSILVATVVAAIILFSVTFSTTKAEASATSKINIKALTTDKPYPYGGPKSENRCMNTNSVPCN